MRKPTAPSRLSSIVYSVLLLLGTSSSTVDNVYGQEMMTTNEDDPSSLSATNDGNNNNNKTKTKTKKTKLHFAMASGGSAYFEPIRQGWEERCEQLGVECEYHLENWTTYELEYTTQEERDETPKPCVEQMRQFIAARVDGMAVKCNVEHEVFLEAQEAGIPVVTFSGEHFSPHDAYVGTDNHAMGRQMARLLKQLLPTGGTYVTAHNGDSSTERHEGFVEEIEKDNNRPDKAGWYGHDLVFNHTGDLGDTDDARMETMEKIASHNPTAIVFMYQTPIRHPNYTQFVDNNRWRNIAYLGTEGNGDELDYMVRKYIDGLVGELTYDMGAFAVDALYKIVTEGRDSVPKIRYTKLVNYNLVPEELPYLDVDDNLISEGWAYVGYTCFGIVAVCSLACTVWSVYYRRGVVVRASQPFFLVMIATGILMMGSALVPLSMDDNGDFFYPGIPESYAIGVCMSGPWLAFVGFTVTFSALFAKTWRVVKFFRSPNAYGRIQVSERDVMGPFAVLFTLNVVILTTWTIVDPLTYIRQFGAGTDLWNRELSSSGSCQSDNAVAYLVPLAIVNLSAVALSCWQAIEARGIKSEFAEAKWIAWAVFSMCQAFLTGIPVVAVVRTIPEAFYLTVTFLIFVVCMVVLWLIFLPKMLMQRRYAKLSPQEQKRAMAVSVKLSSGQLERDNDGGSRLLGWSNSMSASARQQGSTGSSAFGRPLEGGICEEAVDVNDGPHCEESPRAVESSSSPPVTTKLSRGVGDDVANASVVSKVSQESVTGTTSMGSKTTDPPLQVSGEEELPPIGAAVRKIDDGGWGPSKYSSYVDSDEDEAAPVNT